MKDLTDKQSQALLGRAHSVLYDELLHIPLIFYGHGVKQQKIISQQVRQVDMFPTLIDFLNIPDTNEVDGKSLMPLVNGESWTELPAYIETGVRWVKTAKKITRRPTGTWHKLILWSQIMTLSRVQRVQCR